MSPKSSGQHAQQDPAKARGLIVKKIGRGPPSQDSLLQQDSVAQRDDNSQKSSNDAGILGNNSGDFDREGDFIIVADRYIISN